MKRVNNNPPDPLWWIVWTWNISVIVVTLLVLVCIMGDIVNGRF